MNTTILDALGIHVGECEITPIGNGLINHTWKIETNNEAYILQKINHHVFKHPEYIDRNINHINTFLQQHFPDYLFLSPLQNKSGHSLFRSVEGEYFRLFTFVQNSFTFTTVNTTRLAFEAAAQFAKFTRLLSGFLQEQLKETIPHFHNLQYRFTEFETAIKNGNPQRITASAKYIDALYEHQPIANLFVQLQQDASFKKRVMHHDTKISNVLFNADEKGICVIDLDTVMPGYFISDVGDMLRTYVCPVNEEETDFDKIVIREDYFRAIVSGYLKEMRYELTPTELAHFIYAGKFMIYMQSLRFLTDYLNNDIYYGRQYEQHNLNRALNQLRLLKELIKKESILEQIVRQEAGYANV
ncbi:MAG: aminoglycoside phosphotransferase family protein [Sphingobacteriia bacterium]|nr:aminoglycoside phosphotransferase family protein [Sphingobacteriia bacterium]